MKRVFPKRGDVMLDPWRLYVVLCVDDSSITFKHRCYDTLILAVLVDDEIGEHCGYAGQLRHWGEGVESDTIIGRVELPATM